MFVRIRTAAFSSVILLAFLLAVSPAQDTDSVFTIEDVVTMKYVYNAVISPDGHYIAYRLYVPRTPFEDENAPGWSDLHVCDIDGNSRPFVTGKVSVRAIDWTPDGQHISYLAKRDEDQHRSLYVIPIDGGESRKLLEHNTSIKEYQWSPDGQRIAFLASAQRSKESKDAREKGFKQEVYEEDIFPVEVFVANPWDSDTDPRKIELDGSASELHFSPDGEHLVLALAPTPLIDDRYMARNVYVVNIASGEIVTTFDHDAKLGRIAVSPNGKHVAMTRGIDLNDPKEGRLLVGTVAEGSLENLTPDFMGHVRECAFKDNKTIIYLADEGVYTTLNEIDIKSREKKQLIPPGGPVLYGLSVADDGESMAFDGSTPQYPWEVHYRKPGAKQVVRLTEVNPQLDTRRLAKQEVFTYQARDGLELQGILIHPLDEQPGRRYPLIMYIHGGPESHERNEWKTTYTRQAQVLAANGYAMFIPNYRGSTGRGVEFSKMGQNDYAGGEFNDIVDAIDPLVDMGLVDRDKVGITGGSYGGYASAWAATALTEYFAASVMRVGVSDLISKFGTTDIPNEMYLVHARIWPWENWQWYLERSPIYYAQQANTPLLILHGKNDTRVHPSQSMELYRYLKTTGQAPVRLVFYPGEGHGSSKASSRYDTALRVKRWMDHYLQGPGGDPPPYELEYPLEGGDEKGN